MNQITQIGFTLALCPYNKNIYANGNNIHIDRNVLNHYFWFLLVTSFFKSHYHIFYEH